MILELERDILKEKYVTLDKVCDYQKKRIEELKNYKETLLKDMADQHIKYEENQKINKSKQLDLDKTFNSLQQIVKFN